MVLKKSISGKTTEIPAESGESHGASLDRYDIAILRELQQEARLSNTELSARIGLSAAPTWRRVKWLEQQGYITGYRAEIDRRKIGLGDSQHQSDIGRVTKRPTKRRDQSRPIAASVLGVEHADIHDAIDPGFGPLAVAR